MSTTKATAMIVESLGLAHEGCRQLRMAIMEAEIEGQPLTIAQLFERLDAIQINVLIGQSLGQRLGHIAVAP